MSETNEFAHGAYGDDSGVVFYGPPTGGLWGDRLAVSDRYVEPLFKAVLDRARRDPGTAGTPRLVTDWTRGAGWMDAPGIVELPPDEAKEFVAALAGLSVADLTEHCAGVTPEACLRCAAAIGEFLTRRVARGVAVYLESD